ncbi:MAG: bile acid:sodium symporter, partial [Proteobacteria bacterium]|nr:bile acid:sodium symporter [Pseudomonadota bacterium]
NKELAINQGQILSRLLILVLLPLLIGMVMKAMVLSRRKLPESKLQIMNQCMIIGIVFISLAGSRHTLMENQMAFFYILLLVSVFHIMLLGASFGLIKMWGIPRGRCESVIFMGSQKTLALSAIIQMTYFSEFGTALLVCVVHHIVHLMMDGYLSMRMNQSRLL